MIIMDRVYICIDMKSFYASVECVHRGLDPLQARLLVADETRSDQTICLQKHEGTCPGCGYSLR